MKNTIIAAAFGALAFLAAPAQAASITDIYDPFNDASDVFIGDLTGNYSLVCTGSNPDHTGVGDTASASSEMAPCTELRYSHFISPDFTNPPDTLVSAVLKLFFYDNNDPGGGTGAGESYVLTLDGTSQGTFSLNNNSTTTTTIPALTINAMMSADGRLDVILGAGNGANNNFYFERSEVFAEWREPGDSLEVVPEPASMLLLGTGLAGLAARARRRKQQA